MTEPWTEQARQQRYDELLQRTGGALIAIAPPGWRRIDLVAKVVDEAQNVGLIVVLSDFSHTNVDPPLEAVQSLLALRQLMYRPDVGAWLSVRYMMNVPTEFRVFYNYDHDPLWSPPPPAELYGRDLARYPRPPDRIPTWLRGGTPGITDPTGRSAPLTFGGQRELTRKIGDLLALRAPADRDQVRAFYRATGNHEELVGHSMGIDGQLREWGAPPELLEHFRALRAGMYKDGVGTWSAASTVVEWPIRTSLNYLYAEDPRWREPPPRTAVLDELEMFPRAPEHVPDWMTRLLPNAQRVAQVAPRFRHARIFDRRDDSGRPVVNRPPVAPAELPAVLLYLNTAPVIMGGRGFDADVFEPGGTRDVPAAFHTDGAWIWPASVPHYLAKYGVPPEPDFVAHIRANGTPPQADDETKGDAYTALTGELPAGTAPAATQPPPQLSDRERRLLDLIDRRISETGAVAEAYRLLDAVEGARCIERVGDEWQVALYERGKARGAKRFAELWDAGVYLLGVLTFNQVYLRAGGGDHNSAPALNDWPIQPLPGEPPLTLLARKHIAVLMPGREIVRYGPPAGNLTFADGTEFNAMSLRAEREPEGPRRYRVQRELRTVSGQSVPWHNRPGGGTAYLLARSVEQHVADESLLALTDEPG